MILLTSLLLTVNAFAQSSPPPLPPIQIVTAGVIQPVAAKPTVVTKAPGLAAAVSKDQSSAADLRRAEKEFAAARTAGARPAVVAPAVPAPAARVAVAPVVAPAAPVAAPAPAARVAVAPVVTSTVRVVAAPVVRVRAPIAVAPLAVSRAVRRDDAASVIAQRCLAEGKRVIRCMDREISEIETRGDNDGTRVLNCAQLRKIQKAGEPAQIDAFITARLNAQKAKGEAVLTRELIDDQNLFQRRETQLRAAFTYLSGMNELAAKVCSPHLFAETFTAVK